MLLGLMLGWAFDCFFFPRFDWVFYWVGSIRFESINVALRSKKASGLVMITMFVPTPSLVSHATPTSGINRRSTPPMRS